MSIAPMIATVLNPVMPLAGVVALLALILAVYALAKKRILAGLMWLVLLALSAGIAILTAPVGRPLVSSNESATQGDIRTVISAEAGYAGANQDNYGPLSCLNQPSTPGCIAGYPPTAATFLDSTLGTPEAVLTKSGYNRVFLGGTPTTGRNYANYCYQARPAALGRTGTRSFGGDSSGMLGGTQGDVDCCGTAGASAKLLSACPPMN